MSKKGKEKNTVNKAKHSRLMNQKINKLKLEKKLRKEKLREIITNTNRKKNDK